MKKTKKTLLSLLAFILPLSACAKNEQTGSSSSSTPSVPATEKPSQTASPSVSQQPSSDQGLHVDSRLSLFRQGDLYKDSIRAIYLKRNGVSGNIEWTSSNEDIVAIGSTPINGAMPEVNLIAHDYGKAVITAKLQSDPSIYSQYEVVVSNNFTARSEERFSLISSSRKRETTETYYSYDVNYTKSENGKSTGVTIFEENEEQSSGNNLTDAYQISVKESDGKTFEKKYVRDGRYLASEYLDFQNNVRKKDLNNTDEDKTPRYWEISPYFNYLGYSSVVTNKNFISFDNGSTYHFVGGYETAAQICLNFYQEDRAPDDRYFTVENGTITSFHVVIDPSKGNTNETESVQVKYGREITSVLSELGTAEIEHLAKYPHESYQDPITHALNTRKASKNYVSSLTRKTSGSADEKTVYTYTEDTIDIVYSIGNQVMTHTGIHKVDDNNYYEYEHDDASNTTTITKKHNSVFDGTDSSGKTVNRYPTFDFAPEIFDQTSDANTFVSRGNTAQFISYCSYIPATWSLLHSYVGDGTIVLDGKNHLSKASAKRTDGNKNYDLSIDYSAFGTATVNIDFTKATEPKLPASFEEAYPSLAKERKEWNIYDAVPFLYYEPGYSLGVEWERADATNPECAYIRTNRLDDNQAAVCTKFISDYKQVLLNNGYTLSGSKDKHGYDLYVKGEYKISIGNEVNYWNNLVRPAAVIRVYSSLLTHPDN